MVFEKCTAVGGILGNFGFLVVFYLRENAPKCTAIGGVIDNLVVFYISISKKHVNSQKNNTSTQVIFPIFV